MLGIICIVLFIFTLIEAGFIAYLFEKIEEVEWDTFNKTWDSAWDKGYDEGYRIGYQIGKTEKCTLNDIREVYGLPRRDNENE